MKLSEFIFRGGYVQTFFSNLIWLLFTRLMYVQVLGQARWACLKYRPTFYVLGEWDPSLAFFSSWLETEEWEGIWSFEVVWALTSETTNSMKHSWKGGNKNVMIKMWGKFRWWSEWWFFEVSFHWLQGNPGLGCRMFSNTDIQMVCWESDLQTGTSPHFMSQGNCETQFHKQKV